MVKAKIQLEDQDFLFRGIINTTNGERLRLSGKVSYTTMRELFKKKSTELGHPAEEFGLQSACGWGYRCC